MESILLLVQPWDIRLIELANRCISNNYKTTDSKIVCQYIMSIRRLVALIDLFMTLVQHTILIIAIPLLGVFRGINKRLKLQQHSHIRIILLNGKTLLYYSYTRGSIRKYSTFNVHWLSSITIDGGRRLCLQYIRAAITYILLLVSFLFKLYNIICTRIHCTHMMIYLPNKQPVISRTRFRVCIQCKCCSEI